MSVINKNLSLQQLNAIYVKSAPHNGIMSVPNTTMSNQSCNYSLDPVYGQACIYVEGYEQCTSYIKYYNIVYNCTDAETFNPEDLNNPGGPVGGGDPPPEKADCAGIPGGTASADNPCHTCMGGTTGITECPLKRTVTDSTKTPCIKSNVTMGITANTTIGTMLGKTFGSSNEYGGLDIEFTEGDTGTDDGWCRKNGNISWVITINQNLPSIASKEFILSTVYHEILHAYLEATYTKDATGMFLIPHDEHQDMAEKYIILMTGALKINYPSLSDKDAWGLAWGGLHDTPFYKDNTKLTSEQRKDISEINRKHKNKNNQSDRSGNYCN